MNNSKRPTGAPKTALALILALCIILGSGVIPARAAAQVFRDRFEFPFEWIAWVECAAGGAGEEVYVTGTYRVTTQTTIDNRGGFHGKFQIVSLGLEGIGLSTGTHYHGKDMFHDHFNGKVGSTYTAVGNFRLIGQGSGGNLKFSYRFHITVNTNGEVTAYVDRFRATCQ